MVDERVVDQHLGEVLNAVLDAVYQAKQASWAASSSAAQPALQELVSFLIDQSGLLMVAEEAVARGRHRVAEFAPNGEHPRGGAR